MTALEGSEYILDDRLVRNERKHVMKNSSTLTESRKTYRRVMSATTLNGDKVVNQVGEDLGKIDDIMIDTKTGRVAYAVLSFGGFLGLGDKLFAIPWSRLSLDEDRKVFILNIDRATLENAPGFDKDNWPDMADRTWGSEIHTYYSSRPYWEP
jgi:sporulation protein YlmC with PRC-barrel domain